MRTLITGMFIVSLLVGPTKTNVFCPNPLIESQEAGLERIVVKNKLVSTHLPKVTIRFPRDAKYVGGQAFNFLGVAHAEQHFFAVADKQGVIQRLYWVQFESFLPGTSDVYNYKSSERQKLGRLEFLIDTRVRPAGITPSPDSDAARAISFLATKGLRFADENLRARFIHLPDTTRRNELMIIYQESLAPTGLKAADLLNGGAKFDEWQERSRGLITRAMRGIVIN